MFISYWLTSGRHLVSEPHWSYLQASNWDSLGQNHSAVIVLSCAHNESQCLCSVLIVSSVPRPSGRIYPSLRSVGLSALRCCLSMPSSTCSTTLLLPKNALPTLDIIVM
ncbi:hypothetical protein AAFF_G00111680 [Aldrovandia affinis]|uniref:Uncharacterized protein n=1 Tax=Aldrovandia affinis TaxID=143900 RepID=A0AAD7RTM1_9TELE|nr:hypothetical protein AAFF_G00111680 [Aldrovandia affinis]